MLLLDFVICLFSCCKLTPKDVIAINLNCIIWKLKLLCTYNTVEFKAALCDKYVYFKLCHFNNASIRHHCITVVISKLWINTEFATNKVWIIYIYS